MTYNHRVIDDVDTMTTEELEDLYGIQILTDGTVYDPVDEQYHDSLVKWAESVDNQEDDEMYGTWSKIGKRSKYDDGGY